MARRKKSDDTASPDQKTAAAGTDHDLGDAAGGGDRVFDAPLSIEQAMTELIDLNTERHEHQRRWELAKEEASDAKKELDNASNQISLLIDRIDQQRNGQAGPQPVLRTVDELAAVG